MSTDDCHGVSDVVADASDDDACTEVFYIYNVFTVASERPLAKDGIRLRAMDAGSQDKLP